MQRSQTVRFGGALRSENVGTSNRNAGEIPAHRKPKVSLAMAIIQGLGGPKGKPNGVPDGQPVNIPAPQYFFKEVRNLVDKAGYWIPVISLRIFQGLMGSSFIASEPY